MRTDTRSVAYAVVLVAIGVALAPFTSIPLGIARVNPTQHLINIVAAVLLGPWWAVGVAASISIIRNALGVGTILAFPGSMIGAFLAGYLYRATGKLYLGALGEIVGTGIIAALMSALIIAPVFLQQQVAIAALIASFLGSTLLGTFLGILALRLLERTGFVQLRQRSVRT